MALFHMGAIRVGTRGKGRSSVAHASYQSGKEMTNEYDGWTQTKWTSQEVIFHDVLLPKNAPEKYKDAETLWNSIELFEKRIDAQLYRYFDVEFQSEFSDQENKELFIEYVQKTFVEQGMCAQIDIHKKENGYSHGHVMLTMRELDEQGQWMAKAVKQYLCRNSVGEEKYLSAAEFKDEKLKGWEKVYRYEKDGEVLQLTKAEAQNYPDHVRKGRDPVSKKIDLNDVWNNQKNAERWRAAWAEINNKKFAEKGLDITIDHRSYEEQGISILPMESYTRIEIEKMNRKERVEKQERNAKRAEYNKQIYELADVVNQALDSMEDSLIRLENGGYFTEDEMEQIQDELEYNDGLVECVLQASLFAQQLCDYCKKYRDLFRDKAWEIIKEFWDGLKEDKERFWNQNKEYKPKKLSLDDVIPQAQQESDATRRNVGKIHQPNKGDDVR